MFKKAFFLSLLLSTCLFALQAPEPVPRKTKRNLDKASYLQLAGQWKKFIEQSGPSAPAWTNLALAYRYSDQTEAARIAAEKALALDPDYPPALDELGNLLSQDSTTVPRALELLEHCRAVAPDYEEGLNMLAVTYLKRGELDKADEVFRDIYNQNLIERPLMDYGYNMLVSLPQGSVLFTNGDNDTFPPLVLQAGMGFRRDVAVLNRFLINVEPYRKALFRRYPGISFDQLSEKLKKAPLSADPVIRKLLEEAKAPLFLAMTLDALNDPPQVEKGFNYRVIGTGKEIPANEAAETMLLRFRLDSATDWSYPWKLYPSIQTSMSNYALACLTLAGREGLDPRLKVKILDKALEIAEFHHNLELVKIIRERMNK